MTTFTLNAKHKNRVPLSIDLDLSGLQMIFRIKKRVESETAPLVEVLCTFPTKASTSIGYVDVNLEDAPFLSGLYKCEFEINDGAGINNPGSGIPIFYQITDVYIQQRLDN